MRPFIHMYLPLFWHFQLLHCIILTFVLGLKDIPRRILNQESISKLQYPAHQKHTIFLLQESKGVLYVGGTDLLLKINVGSNRIEKYLVKNKANEECTQGTCENTITVLQEFKDSLLVCYTNGYKPQCWKLESMHNHSREKVDNSEGTGMSPYVYTQNSLSLTVEGDLYAAAPLDADGRNTQFRRINPEFGGKAGGRPNVRMDEKWLSEPTFISASWVKRRDDPNNDKIYIFFREKNPDNSSDADPWISRVARVCKLDEGGPKRVSQFVWTSFLKARLACGFSKEPLYFNRLQDVYVLHAEDWRETRVYTVFTSIWNSTAVCVYSMAEIDKVFENSTFKGFKGVIPNPRPGTCVKNSKDLSRETINPTKDDPEMHDWIHSAPLYVTSSNYTKLAVDQVQAADGTMHNILLLATDTGKIHKCLEAGSELFIISETQLSNQSLIQAMKLDSKKKKLIVGFAEQIFSVDLQRCQDYNSSCAECVLSRDPYCAWTEYGCTSPTMGSRPIQNIIEPQTNVCTAAFQDLPSPVVYTVPLDVPVYLSCPIDSYHAIYTWEHHGQRSHCQQMQSHCLYLIPAMANGTYGDYKCVSQERDYTKVVTEYQLAEPTIQHTNGNYKRGNSLNGSSAAVLVSHLALSLSAFATVSRLWF